MHFSEKVKALRGQHNLRQSELAESSGLTANKVQRYEQSNQKPKGDDALALARALGVTADYLLDDSLPFPPAEEHLSEKVVIIRKLEGLIAALQSRVKRAEPGPGAAGEPGAGGLPNVVHLPVYRLGAGFDVTFDASGRPDGEKVRDMYFDGLGDGRFFAAELYGSSMHGGGDTGFALGEIVVFRMAEHGEVASGDYVYARTERRGMFRQAFIDGGRLRLRALNPADPEITADWPLVKQIGRLVRRIREY